MSSSDQVLPCSPLSLVMDYAQDSTSLFHYDPLTSPTEFKMEVKDWLKASDPSVPASTVASPSTSYDSSSSESFCASPYTYSDHLFSFNQFSNPSPMPYFPHKQDLQYPPCPPNSLNNSSYPSHYPAMPFPSPVVEVKKETRVKRTAKTTQSLAHRGSVCSNCFTRETTMWRWNVDGQVECNACNVYEKRNNRKRPLHLRKNVILRRNRNKPSMKSQNLNDDC